MALVLASSALGGIAALGGAASVLVLPEPARKAIVPWLVAFATGSLLGAALIGLVPEALETLDAQDVGATMLAGFVIFYVLHEIALLPHPHGERSADVHAAAKLVVLGDAFHNFVDGVVVAAAFHASVPMGISTVIAVTAHELPQEIGDFAILLHAGWSRRRALMWNAISGLAGVLGALVGWLALDAAMAATPYVMAVSAASFLYIALAQLVPDLHRHAPARITFARALVLAAGMATFAMLHR